ncbi:nuclear transport factor 2 family protein [Nocardia sp. NPDC056952]|uniref:nuclear transport factor 2 family protein n=1 Tax=Nocardia sp. NPDC056952 TaxID=3345979 RepID=UPI003625C364
MPTALERLIAIEDCKQARYNFHRSLDTKDRDRYLSTVSADLVFIPKDANNLDLPEIVMNGADTFWGFAEQVLLSRKSIHLGVAPQITVIDENNATGFWYIYGYGELTEAEAAEKAAEAKEIDEHAKQALEIFAADAGGSKKSLAFESIEDEYVRIDGKWVISRILVTALASL